MTFQRPKQIYVARPGLYMKFPNQNLTPINMRLNLTSVKMLLTSIKYVLDIKDNICQTTIIQEYMNPMNESVEIEYLFRTDP
jgi:hypothetical protein